MSFHTIRMFPVCAALAALALPAAVMAQTPPNCWSGICTVTLANAGSPVVDGCGEHATPGRMKLILSSTNPNVTRRSFNINIGLITSANDFGSTFSDWEWRTAGLGGGQWRNPDSTNKMNFSGGVLGENIIEVRPKAGARVWTNRNPSNPNRGPGELVIPVFTPPVNTSQWTENGSAHFLFMGGKGCARVGPGGGLLGGNQ